MSHGSHRKSAAAQELRRRGLCLLSPLWVTRLQLEAVDQMAAEWRPLVAAIREQFMSDEARAKLKKAKGRNRQTGGGPMSPATRELRAMGLVPLPAWWVSERQIEAIRRMAYGHKELVHEVRMRHREARDRQRAMKKDRAF